MRNYSLRMKLVVCCACGVVCGAIGLMNSPSYAQGRVLTRAQLDDIVSTELSSCAATPSPAAVKSGAAKLQSGKTDPATIIPTRNAKEITVARVAKTLHGMWRGRVLGDDKDVGVDYFWIMDTQRGEGLLIAQRTGKETMAAMQAAGNAPKLTYLMCAHEGYAPSKETPQIHEFVKVSSSLAEAPRILAQSTGLKMRQARPTISEIWQGLVAMRYFEKAPATAFAGGFFKPLTITRNAKAVGPPQIALRWDGEYRGGGSTSLQFTAGVPMKGVEHASFVGTSATAGDFLVSSPGNGELWKVEAFAAGNYDLGFDSVVLGPMEQ